MIVDMYTVDNMYPSYIPKRIRFDLPVYVRRDKSYLVQMDFREYGTCDYHILKEDGMFWSVVNTFHLENPDKVSKDPNDKLPNDLEEARKIKYQEISAARYEAEVGGIEIAGAKIKTDYESQMKFTGACLQAVDDPNYTCTWKAQNGFVTLNNQQIKAIGVAIRQHVQSCFDKEGRLFAAIKDADSVLALEAINW